ncbi:MAG: ABC transporter permease [Acidobacteria bacterium]|nr:ABC transporter permease [Acidobacteriota bacterium]
MALGLGLVAVVFTFYNALFLRVDAVRNPGELFAVRRPPHPGARNVWVPFTRPEYEALRRETAVFTDAVAMLRGVDSCVDGRLMSCTLVTGNFFQVLGVNAALGRTLTPPDDERSAGQPVIVLSHSSWSKLYAGDPSIVGRRVRVNGVRTKSSASCRPAFAVLASALPISGHRSRWLGSLAGTRGAKTRSRSTSSAG